MNTEFKPNINDEKMTKLLRTYGAESISELIIQYDLGLLTLSDSDEAYLIGVKKTNELEVNYDSDMNDFEIINNIDYSFTRIISSIGNSLKKNCSSERDFKIIVAYYNGWSMTLLQQLEDQYNLTGERIRQIIEKNTKKVNKICIDNTIRACILPVLDYAADEMLRTDTLLIEDEFFTNVGIANLFSAIYPDRYEIFKIPKTYGEWLAKRKNNLVDSVPILIEQLRSNPQVTSLKEIIESKEKSMEIKKVIKDKKKNVQSMQIGVLDCSGSKLLEETIVKIFESKPNQLLDCRAIQRRLKIIYGEKLPRDLASIKKVVIRLVDNGIIQNASISGYYVYYESAFQIKERKTLSLFIGNHIGSVVEIRYWTNRKDSEKKWRQILVQGQDEWFVFAIQENGKRMCFNKTNIIEYRDI